ERERRAAVDGESDLVLGVARRIDHDRLHLVVEVERVRRVEGAVARTHALLAVDVDRKWHRCPSLSTLPDGDVRFRRGTSSMTAGDGVIDADAHVNEDPLAWTELEARHPGWLSAGQSGGKWVAKIGEKLYPTQVGKGSGVPIVSAISDACAAGAADLDRRLADMDAEGIDVQVLFGGLIIGLTSYDDAGFALDVARAYNDWLLTKVCGHAPDRLKGVATVPLQDVDRSVEEARRAAGIGAVAVTIPPVVGAANLDDPVLLPFFEACASLDLAVAVHSAPGMNLPLPGAERFDNYAQVHCLSF